jgi:alkylhydroperoxidase/carboxymuconolactone decarboxylase family protein YurZ
MTEDYTGVAWDSVRALDPDFLETYVRMADVPRRGGHLSERMRAFVGLVVDANVTHLDPDGVRRHVRAALDAGATTEEVMEVLECTATVSVHAMNVGVPLLVEVLGERGERTDPAPLTEYQEKLKDDFTRQRGYWNPTWDEMLELTPEMFEAYTDFSSHPWRTGNLSPLEKELLYIAFDTSSTHLYRVGLKLHIENALGYGGTPQQILEVMEIAVLIGMKAVTVGAPILKEEVAARATTASS